MSFIDSYGRQFFFNSLVSNTGNTVCLFPVTPGDKLMQRIIDKVKGCAVLTTSEDGRYMPKKWQL